MKNNYPLLFAILTFIFVFMATYNVYLFGDDYYYITFSQGSIQDFFNHHINHYLLDNGRVIVHLLASIFLSVNLIWWKIFNSFMLATIAYLGSKLVSRNSFYASLTFFAGTCLIGINVSRQSIYWLTGSFNYVYPIFMLFIFWYLIEKYINNNRHTLLLCLLGFLASSTVEQGSMMVLGLTIILFLKEIIITKKFNKKLFFVLLFVIIGTSSVILSPATFARIKSENEITIPLFIKVATLLKFLTKSFILSKWILPINIFFLIVSSLKFEKIFLKLIILSGIPILLFCVLYAKSKIEIIFCLIVLLTILLIIVIKNISKEIKDFRKNKLLFSISLILLLGSQLMLIVSSVYGDRNILFGIYMYYLIIATQIKDIDCSNTLLLIITIFLVFLGIKNQFTIIKGYSCSNKIEAQNIFRIKNNTNEILTLVKPNVDYTWSMPYVSDYHKYYYKKYYRIENINVIWK